MIKKKYPVNQKPGISLFLLKKNLSKEILHLAKLELFQIEHIM